MLNPIIVIHAEDSEELALYLVVVLSQFGYDAITFNQAAYEMDPSEVSANWPNMVSNSSVVIILLSELFAKESLFVEIAHAASAEKKAIFATNETTTHTLDEFPGTHINLSSDPINFYRGLNKIVQGLSRYMSMWSIDQKKVLEQQTKERLKIN